MKDTVRRSGLFLLAIMLLGCASAADDPALPSEQATASASDALQGVAAPSADAMLDADAADCDPSAVSAATDAAAHEEFSSILQSSGDDLDALKAASTCTRVCRCCRNNGNRFCCSHCRFCSGPIGVSSGVLAP